MIAEIKIYRFSRAFLSTIQWWILVSQSQLSTGHLLGLRSLIISSLQHSPMWCCPQGILYGWSISLLHPWQSLGQNSWLQQTLHFRTMQQTSINKYTCTFISFIFVYIQDLTNRNTVQNMCSSKALTQWRTYNPDTSATNVNPTSVDKGWQTAVTIPQVPHRSSFGQQLEGSLLTYSASQVGLSVVLGTATMLSSYQLWPPV